MNKPKMFCAFMIVTAVIFGLLVREGAPNFTVQEETEVFFELPDDVQVELLAGAIALLSQPEDGYVVRLTIGGVLLNRLALPQWGDTLGQVTSSLLGSEMNEIPLTNDEGAMIAATDALKGHMPVPGATRFGRGRLPEGMEEGVEFGGYWFCR